MTETVLSVENLGKQYVVGGADQIYGSFRELLTGVMTAPYRRMKKLSGDVAKHEQFWALKGIDFEVGQGEVVGIIGRNGAGKSTLLKIFSRITSPTCGKVTVRGRVASLLEVGTGFHPELTGRENIYLNGAILGMTRREITAKFDEIIAFAEVEKFIDTPVKRYSSGMYVRLAFAVAAHLEPDILVVDEVLAIGDRAFQERCLGKLDAVAGEGRTVLFVSHQLNMISSLCTRTLLLNNGTIAQDGLSSKVIDQYLKTLAGGKYFKVNQNEKFNQNVYLKNVQILGPNLGGATSDGMFSFDEEIKIKINYKVPYDNYFVAVTIENSRGVKVLSSWDSDDGSRPSLEPGQEVVVLFSIPASHLAPDSYTIYIDVDIYAHGRSLTHETTQNLIEINEIGFHFQGGRTVKGSRPLIWNFGGWVYPDVV